MDTTSIVTLILSFMFSLVTAYFVSQREIAKLREENKIRREEEVKRYLRPILRAASDLQGRLWHLTQIEAKKMEIEGKSSILLQQDENQTDHPNWPMTKRDYLTSTLYFFAQYFAWIEILHQETQFIEIAKDEMTRDFQTAIKDIEVALAETDLKKRLEKLGALPWVTKGNLQMKNANTIQSDRPLFRLQQAVIGQSIIKKDQGSLSCTNYLEFQNLYETTLHGQADFTCLRDLITRAVNRDPYDFSLARCCLVANCLVDLMNLLDPQKKFVFSSERAYVEIPGFT